MEILFLAPRTVIMVLMSKFYWYYSPRRQNTKQDDSSRQLSNLKYSFAELLLGLQP